MLPSPRLHPAPRWLRACLAAALLAALTAGPGLRAAPAADPTAAGLDTHFGGYGEAGRVIAQPASNHAFRDALQLSDGSVIAAGSTGDEFLIARYLPGGALDTTFGVQGVRVVNFSASPDFANTVAVDSDGRIVAAGVANTGTAANFGVVRLDPDGALDTTFNGTGSQVIDFNGRRDIAQAVFFVDGDILVAGSAEEAGAFCAGTCPSNFGVARLNGDDGQLDGGFGTAGKVQTDLVGSEIALALTSGTCGFYAAGFRAAGLNSPPQFVIARYNAANGSPITAFGNSGVVTGTTLSRIVDMTCLPDTSLLALGDGHGDGDDTGDVGLLNLTDEGDPVGGFGAGGLRLFDFGGVDAAGDLHLLPDYTAVVAGASGLSLAVGRFTNKGELVTGTVALRDMTDAGAASVQALGAGLIADVRIRAIASLETSAGPRLAFTQWFLDGSPDDGGRQALDYQRQTDEAAAVAFQPDGKLLVAGSTHPGSGAAHGLLARYAPDGQLDAQFGLGGLARLTAFDSGAVDLAVLPDGKIAVMGADFDLVRLTTAGAVDDAFGASGYASANWASAMSNALARQGDGKLVLAGSRNPTGNNPTFAVARFTPEGELDGLFGGSGTVATGVGPFSGATDVTVQPDGKIVAAGLTATDVNNGLTWDFALVRYLSNGSVDNTFGANGRVSTDFGAGEAAMAVLALPDGRLLAGGFSTNQGMALARYLTNGELDSSFGAGGKVLLQFTGNEIIGDLALDGPYVLAAVCDQVVGAGLVARLTAAGAFDSGFHDNGRAAFDFPGVDCPMALAARPGRVGAVGTTRAGFGALSGYLTPDFAIAVFEGGQYDLFLPTVARGP